MVHSFGHGDFELVGSGPDGVSDIDLIRRRPGETDRLAVELDCRDIVDVVKDAAPGAFLLKAFDEAWLRKRLAWCYRSQCRRRT